MDLSVFVVLLFMSCTYDTCGNLLVVEFVLE